MHYIQGDKFSETSVSIRWLDDLCAENLTAWNLLLGMLRNKTEALSEKQKISLARLQAYDWKMGMGMNAYGDQLMIEMKFSWIRSDWIQDTDYEDKILFLIDQFLFHVLLDEESLEEAKFFLKQRLNRMQDDPDTVAFQLAVKQVQGSHSISFSMHGKQEEVDAIDLKQIQILHDHWSRLPRSIYVCGQIGSKVRSYLSAIDEDPVLSNQRTLLKEQPFVEVFQTKDILQTSLVKLYATQIDINSELYEALILFVSLLGQSPYNLLFETIREKQSLCYSIHATLIRYDGALLVQAGIQKKDIQRVSELIDEQIRRIEQQEYKEEWLEIAKKDWIDDLQGGLDRPFTQIERHFQQDLLNNSMSIENQIQSLRKVTKDDLTKVAQKIRPLVLAVVKEQDHEDA